MDPMELRNVNVEPDDDSCSADIIQDSYTGMGNSDKEAASRYGVKNYQALWKNRMGHGLGIPGSRWNDWAYYG